MTLTTSKAVMIGLLLAGSNTPGAWAQDEPRDQARSHRKEAAAQSERGGAEAREPDREAQRREPQSRQAQPNPDLERELGQLKERLHDLLARQKKLSEADALERERAEVRERIAGTERELHAVSERLDTLRRPRPDFEAQVRRIEEAARRIHHIRVAAENLKAAEVHDLAMKLMEKAELMERDLREAKERLAEEMHRPGDHDPRTAEIQELRRRNERLQAEIRELRQNPERR
ncbi:MAG: hypothetical protein KGM43_17655 [Planctomycetota bacterium]|nr:hypothetical protein [Planctomycetota bacterium]